MRKVVLKQLQRIVLLGLLFVVLYLIIGAVAPFIHYKKISKETKVQTDVVSKVYDTKNGTDRAKLLETNASAWEDRIRLLHLAKDRIILSTFDMREGKSTTDLAAILLKKADEGVKISILVDGLNGEFRMHDNDFFYALSSHENIEIRFYNPMNLFLPWKTQGRMHDKYIIVDDLAYILGGRNTFDYFIGEYKTNNRSYDREVLIYNTKHGTGENQDSSLYQVEDYFTSVWNSDYVETFGKEKEIQTRETVKEKKESLLNHYRQLVKEKPEYFEDYDYEQDTVPTESVTLLSGDIGIYGKEPKVLYQLEQLMSQAKEAVRIHTPYAVCNSYMYDVLRKVKESVPEVTMMINSIENGDNFFASSDYRINKKNVVETGVQIYEYDGGNSYHGKSIVIDDNISIVGSFNYDLRSTYMDTELMVAVNSKELTAQLTENMEALEKDCRKVVTAKEYEVPDHITVQEIPTIKKAAMFVVGWVSQLFRFLI